jgi:hypothetical protein
MPDKKDSNVLSEASKNTALVNAEDQERVRGDEFFSIYANNIALGFSSWDTWLTFGEIVGVKDGKPVIEEIVKISMTREFFKTLSQVLAVNIAAYEEQFGEITNPHFPPIDKARVVNFETLGGSTPAKGKKEK